MIYDTVWEKWLFLVWDKTSLVLYPSGKSSWYVTYITCTKIDRLGVIIIQDYLLRNYDVINYKIIDLNLQVYTVSTQIWFLEDINKIISSCWNELILLTLFYRISILDENTLAPPVHKFNHIQSALKPVLSAGD